MPLFTIVMPHVTLLPIAVIVPPVAVLPHAIVVQPVVLLPVAVFVPRVAVIMPCHRIARRRCCAACRPADP